MNFLCRFMKWVIIVAGIPTWLFFIEAVNMFYVKKLDSATSHMRTTLLVMLIWLFFVWLYGKICKRSGRFK